jgi:isopentenyl diphosphate isomerase/L-lactate dehydrogenase-like FMN-dependent dehydrogenase
MIVTVGDARAVAKKRLPKIFFDYIDGGAFSETTLRANQADFAALTLEQRVLDCPTRRDLSTDYLGKRHSLPFLLGPVGFLGLYAGGGEALAARAAAARGLAFCLSTFSIADITALRAETTADLQFQLYVLKDRGLSLSLMESARAAGVETLYVTVDCPITSLRERDVRNGFRALESLTLGLGLQMLRRPGWCLDQLAHFPPKVGFLRDQPQFGRGVLAQAAALSRDIDPSLSWTDIAWLRDRWPGKLVVKGLMAAEDARLAFDRGADAVVVSNHGGRQLDGAASTISRLPEIATACPGRDVLLDGGIRRGTDIVKALALGAAGVLLGRAYVWGLAAGGQAGVMKIIDLLAAEIDITLALMGISSIDELKRRGRAVIRESDHG